MQQEDLTREDCVALLSMEYPKHIIALKYGFSDWDFFEKLKEWGLTEKRTNWDYRKEPGPVKVQKAPVQPEEPAKRGRPKKIQEPEPEKKEQRPATISPPVIGPEPGPAPLDPSKFIGYPPRRYENICGRPIITVARTFVKIARGAVVTAPEQYQDPDTHFRAMVCLYAPDRGRTILIKPGENGHRFSVENRTKCTNSVIGSTAPGVYNALIEFGIPLPTHYEARWDDALGGWLGHLL